MKQRQGLSLIELLIAITLLSLLIVAVSSILPSIVSINQKSSDDLTVTTVAKRFFEDVRGSWLADQKGSYLFDGEQFANGQRVIDYSFPETFSRACQIRIEALTPGPVIERKLVSLVCLSQGRTFTFRLELGRPL